MTMKTSILVILLIMIFESCDPMRRINMKNQTSGEAEITWYIKEDSIFSSPLYISNSQEVSFQIPPVEEDKKIRMSFGSGSWSPAVLTNFVDDLDSMVVKWNNQTAVLNTTESMYHFLLARRRGLDKSKIHIRLKDE